MYGWADVIGYWNIRRAFIKINFFDVDFGQTRVQGSLYFEHGGGCMFALRVFRDCIILM